MKTFIWNTEYEVFAAMAETVEQARGVIHDTFKKNNTALLIDEKDSYTLKQASIPTYVYYRAQSVLGNIASLLEIWGKEPDIILEANQGVIYDHANE